MSDPPGAEMVAGLLLTGVWFGLLTGLIELVVLGTQKLLFHKLINLSQYFPWMTPVPEVALFLVVSLVLVVLGIRWRWSPRRGSRASSSPGWARSTCSSCSLSCTRRRL